MKHMLLLAAILAAPLLNTLLPSPVGDLRWRAPNPASKWEGVRKADAFAHGCIQAVRNPFDGPGVSEDGLEALDNDFAWRRTPEGEAWVKK